MLEVTVINLIEPAMRRHPARRNGLASSTLAGLVDQPAGILLGKEVVGDLLAVPSIARIDSGQFW